MGDLATIAKLTFGQIALVFALFLPGFVSIKLDRLIHPSEDLKAPELVIDAIGYSVVNLGLLGWLSIILFRQMADASPDWRVLAPVAALIFLIGPLIWPIAFRLLQRVASRRGLAMAPYLFAFDSFFARKQPCWIVVHLPSGAVVGGYMGASSAASLAPQSGHLYIEELWRLGANSEFIEPVPSSRGAIFRPSDYHWIEIFADREAANAEQ